MDEIAFRSADARDSDRIADLHADSWRRFYRGAYSDSFLDGDLVADRRVAWAARLAAPEGTATIVAEHERLVGFIHVVFDHDPQWGSLIYNVHVVHDRRGTGIGRELMRRGARAVSAQAGGDAMFLWVLEQNTAAQRFYRACGAVETGRQPVPPPGGDPGRLTGDPYCLRMVWPDAGLFAGPHGG
jgi:ribosomal protein S18 acetylase RimI-like enzyme